MTRYHSHPQLSLPAGRQGFTLTELMVVTSILTVVSLVVMGAIAASNDFWQYGTATLDANAQAARSVQRIVGELRNMMGATTICSYNNQIASNNSLGFFPLADVDGDGTTSNAATGVLEYARCPDGITPATEIQFFRNPAANQLRRMVINGCDGSQSETVVADGITSLQFVINNDPAFAGGDCSWRVAGSPCPAAARTVVVQVQSVEQVLEAGGLRPITRSAAMTVNLRHDRLPGIPFTYNVGVTQLYRQEDFVLYQYYPEDTFPQ
ncbi:MAG: type II secretion system protein [Candidatus Omnitrophica bacterium]|nr:type II secretion system protein [Candidatus Omnitrophota bacterium]